MESHLAQVIGLSLLIMKKEVDVSGTVKERALVKLIFMGLFLPGIILHTSQLCNTHEISGIVSPFCRVKNLDSVWF